MKNTKSISVGTKEITHQKVIIAAWYSHLKEAFDAKKISSDDFIDCLKVHVVYDLDNDGIDLVFSASDELLEQFRNKILHK